MSLTFIRVDGSRTIHEAVSADSDFNCYRLPVPLTCDQLLHFPRWFVDVEVREWDCSMFVGNHAATGDAVNICVKPFRDARGLPRIVKVMELVHYANLLKLCESGEVCVYHTVEDCLDSSSLKIYVVEIQTEKGPKEEQSDLHHDKLTLRILKPTTLNSTKRTVYAQLDRYFLNNTRLEGVVRKDGLILLNRLLAFNQLMHPLKVDNLKTNCLLNIALNLSVNSKNHASPLSQIKELLPNILYRELEAIVPLMI